jgi:Spy/CpxP family protein refolding chaperone
MASGHGHGPKMVLQHGAALELTAVQVQQLEALQAAHKAECEERMARVQAAEAAAEAALVQADLATYEAQLRTAAGYKVECKVDMARISQAGLALLTPGQRARLMQLSHAGHSGH